MGAIHHIQIQVLHGSIWVPIAFFTCECGGFGFPVRKVVFKVKADHGVNGNYGRNQATCSWDSNRIDIMRFHTSNENSKSNPTCHTAEQPASKRKRIMAPGDEITATSAVPTIKTEDDGKEEGHNAIELDTPSDDDYGVWEERDGYRCVYYSVQDFRQYISTVISIMETTLRSMLEAGDYDGCNNLLRMRYYVGKLEPVITWCKMALTAGPSNKLNSTWGDGLRMHNGKEFIDQTTEKLRAAQSALCDAHTRFMSQFKLKFPLPGQH